MRIVFAGSGAFAVPTLRALAASPHEILLVVSQPDRPAGRAKTPTAPPVAEVARAADLPLAQPERINAAAFRERLTALAPDVLVVASYGQILKPAVLEIPRQGCLNVHGSLLPRHRGASPVQAAILSGDQETGVTIMKMDAGLDTGPVILERSTSIGETETAGELHDRLAGLGGDALLEALDAIEAGTARPVPQDDAAATVCGLITKADGRVDWSLSAEAIARHVRAMSPWPGAWTRWERAEEGPLRVILQAVAVETQLTGPPGEILAAKGDVLLVGAGQSAVQILELKPAGRSAMDAASFLRGYHLRPGDRFETGTCSSASA